MRSRILVAIDGSHVSPLVMNAAIQLAENKQAKLKIIYIADEFVPVGEGISIDFKQHEINKRKEGELILNNMLQLALAANIATTIHLIEMQESNDLIADKIVAEAKAWRADLILMGTHGRTGLTRILLGSVAEEVVRLSPIPVRVIADEAE